jgi:phage terminase large subunit
MLLNMKVTNPYKYKVYALGKFASLGMGVYNNFFEREFDEYDLRKQGIKCYFGVDFGYTNDPSALWCGLIDLTSKTIYVFDEMYKEGMSNEAIEKEVTQMGYRKERIRADSAEPKSIDRLRELGLSNIKAARKGKDSVNNGIDFIQDFKILIHPRCVNFITEISNYTWDVDKFGKKLNIPIDDFNHLMDAMRYALEDFIKGNTFSFD